MADPEFIFPLVNWRTTGGWRAIYRDSSNGRLYEHGGQDGESATGTTLGADIIACGAARVHAVHTVGDGWGDGSFGNCVVLDHQGTPYYTITAHMDEIAVTLGQLVKQGQRIGTVGLTGLTDGPHVHWGCDKNEGFAPQRQPDAAGIWRIGSTTLVDPAQFVRANAPAPAPTPGGVTLADVAHSLNNLNAVVIEMRGDVRGISDKFGAIARAITEG